MKGLVFFQEVLAGEVQETEEGEFFFQYHSNYLATGGRPISFSLPLTSEPFKSRQIHGFFDGLLPEGWLLNLAAKHWQLNPLRDRYELLIKTAYDAVGAVSVREPDSSPPSFSEVLIPQKKYASPQSRGKCLYCYEPLKNGDYHESCSEDFFGFSIPPAIDLDAALISELEKLSVSKQLAVPGVQRKLSLDLRGDGKETRLTITNFAGQFILKPSGRGPHLSANEDLVMKLARLSGVQIAPTAMVRLSDENLGLLSRRLDRGDHREKYHMEDFCQILDQLTLKKYVGSLNKVAKVLRACCASNAPQEQVLRLFELALFSFIVGNSDLHLKNISVLYPLPQLAPAYDLLSFKIFEGDYEESETEQSALAINGKKNKLTKYDFDQLAESFGIKPKVRDYVYKKMLSCKAPWQELISKSFLSERKKMLLKELVEVRLKMFEPQGIR